MLKSWTNKKRKNDKSFVFDFTILWDCDSFEKLHFGHNIIMPCWLNALSRIWNAIQKYITHIKIRKTMVNRYNFIHSDIYSDNLSTMAFPLRYPGVEWNNGALRPNQYFFTKVGTVDSEMIKERLLGENHRPSTDMRTYKLS